MAIYRPQRPCWRLTLGALLVGVLVGLVIGLVVGGDETDLTEAGGQIKASLASAASILEVAEVEYAESVDGSGVVSETEYEGSLDALSRSRSEFNEAKGGLAAIDEARSEEIGDAYARLEALMKEPAPPDEVETAIGDLEVLLAPD